MTLHLRNVLDVALRLLVVAPALSAAIAFAAPPGWNLTFSDEFEGTSLDTSKWDPIFWTTPFNNEQQAYHPSRATVANGNLALTADDADLGPKRYTSGKVESKFAQQHGRWEIRAKLPGTRGTWPAIWLLPRTDLYNWPTQGEIDILENRGHQPTLTSSAFHWGPNFSARQFVYEEHVASHAGVPANYHDEFHTYAVEWDAHLLRFFVDDVHHFSVHNETTGGFLASQSAPMELNLNVAVGGDFLGSQQPNSQSQWPQQMLVDYVRVYQRDASPPPVVLRNGSFDEQGGSLAGWSVFGNSTSNVQPHREAILDGTDALKLFGQFNGNQNYSGIEQGITVSPGDRLAATVNALVRSADDLTGGNLALMKFDYYAQFGGAFGSSAFLGSDELLLADAATSNDVWHERALARTAPAGAVEARLVLLFIQPDFDGGAVHIDNVSFTNLDRAPPADSDFDQDVDGRDLLNWQRGFGLDDAVSPADGDFNFNGTVGASDLALWEAQFGASSGSSVARVPEPTAAAAIAAGLACWSLMQGGRQAADQGFDSSESKPQP